TRSAAEGVKHAAEMVGAAVAGCAALCSANRAGGDVPSGELRLKPDATVLETPHGTPGQRVDRVPIGQRIGSCGVRSQLPRIPGRTRRVACDGGGSLQRAE